MENFDPNTACVENGNYFGFTEDPQTAPLVLISVPWDVTSSYRPGSALGPEAIMKASYQLDFYRLSIPKAWELGISTLPLQESETLKLSSSQLRPIAEALIEGRSENPSQDTALINAACEALNDWVSDSCKNFLEKGQKIGIIGGDHSCPLAYMKLLAQIHPDFGILHIDAHADLRKAYEDFTYSHASIMYNALQIPQISKIVQVGIRDFCEEEVRLAESEKRRISQFYDEEIQSSLAEGGSWASLCHKILEQLPSKVYISFDIDGLDPSLCPHTGTPVPGGLSFGQASYLIEQLRKSGKEIIGFDLCECAPSLRDPQNDWDGNVGARILYQLSCACLYAQ